MNRIAHSITGNDNDAPTVTVVSSDIHAKGVPLSWSQMGVIPLGNSPPIKGFPTKSNDPIQVLHQREILLRVYWAFLFDGVVSKTQSSPTWNLQLVEYSSRQALLFYPQGDKYTV